MSGNSLERISKKGRKIPKSLYFLLASINAGGIYAIFGGFYPLVLFIAGIVMIILAVLRALLKNGVRKEVSKYSPWLMWKYTKMTKKYIVAGAIGLFLAIIIISQALIVPDSLNQKIVEDKVNELNVPGITISQSDRKIDGFPIFWKDPKFNDRVIGKIESKGFEVTKYENFTYGRFYEHYVDTANSSIGSLENTFVIELTKEKFDLINKYVDLNVKYEDGVNISLYTQYSATHQTNIEKIQIKSYDENPINTTIPIQVNGEISTELSRQVSLGDFYVSDFSDISNANNIILIHSKFYTNFIDKAMGKGLNVIEIYNYYLSSPNLQNTDIGDYVIDLDNLVDTLYIEIGGDPSIRSPLQSELRSVSNFLSFIRVFSSIMSAPVIGLALFLIYFSVNLVRKRKEQLMTIAKIRGVMERQIGSMVMFELIVSSVISIAVGMLLSIPFIGFNNMIVEIFGNISTFQEYVIPQSWYWQVPLVGMILSFDLNITNVFSLIKMTIEEGNIAEENKKSFFRKYNIDLIIFLIGILQYVIIEALRYFRLPEIFLILVYITVPFGIVGFILGTTLIVERYFPSYSGWISNLLWTKRGDMFALATRNLRKSKFSASRLAAILVFGIVVTSLFLTMPGSVEESYQQTWAYTNGANDTVYMSTSNYTKAKELTEKVQDIEGIKAVSLIAGAGDRYGGSSTYAIGLDPDSVTNVLYWKNNFADKSLPDLVNIIRSNDTFLTSTEMKKLRGYEVGSDADLRISNKPVRMKVGGFFKLFPIVKRYNDGSPEAPVPIVMNIDTLVSISNKSLSSGLDFSLLVKIDDSADFDKIDNEISLLGLGLISFSNRDSEGSIFDTTLKLLSSSFIFISLITSVVAIGYYSFISLADRSREIGIYRALGMVSNQIFRLLITESIFILLNAITFGVGMTFIILRYFVILGSFGDSSQVQIIVFYFPPAFYVFIVGMILASVVASLIPTLKLARQETGSVLRGD